MLSYCIVATMCYTCAYHVIHQLYMEINVLYINIEPFIWIISLKCLIGRLYNGPERKGRRVRMSPFRVRFERHVPRGIMICLFGDLTQADSDHLLQPSLTMDIELHCNHLSCRKALLDKAVVVRKILLPLAMCLMTTNF